MAGQTLIAFFFVGRTTEAGKPRQSGRPTSASATSRMSTASWPVTRLGTGRLIRQPEHGCRRQGRNITDEDKRAPAQSRLGPFA